MPPRYGYLTDRMRDFLENPEDYDSQESAEIAYHIRKSQERALEDADLLGENRDLWTKESAPEPPATAQRVRTPPHGADCGVVVEIEDRELVEDPDRYGTKVDGGYCSIEPDTTKEFTEEIALCYQHSEDWEPPSGD